MVRPLTERMSVVGVFNNPRDAQAAVRDLKAAGFRDDEIGIVGPGQGDDVKRVTDSADGGTHAAEGAATGIAAGAGIGALWAVGIAAGLLPGIGPVIAGGVLTSILASAASGAAVAGLAGALVGLGIPEEEATYYENEFKSGRTVVTVKTTTRQDEARRILNQFSGYDMESRPDRAVGMKSSATTAPTRTSGITGRADECRTESSRKTATGAVEGRKVELKEEQLKTQKVQKQAGEVRVRKDVITEHKTVDVPVSREEVVIERHAAHGNRTAGNISDLDDDTEIRVPIMEEEVQVTKTPVVKEEVTIGKRKTTESRHVEADVKHEELHVDDSTRGRSTGSASTRDPKRTSR